jgi:hypothetical protein
MGNRGLRDVTSTVRIENSARQPDAAHRISAACAADGGSRHRRPGDANSSARLGASPAGDRASEPNPARSCYTDTRRSAKSRRAIRQQRQWNAARCSARQSTGRRRRSRGQCASEWQSASRRNSAFADAGTARRNPSDI